MSATRRATNGALFSMPCIASLLLLAPCADRAEASALPSTTLLAVRAATPPPADASLSDPVWATAARATSFEDVTRETPAATSTTALVLYDDTNLYVGWIATQTAPLTVTQAVNDVGYGLDDGVTVAIDTSGANSREYAFTATPAGVRYEYSSESSRYQPPWSVAAKIGDGGYRILMTIPLADMKLSGTGIQPWRVNFTRRTAATNTLDSWAWNPATYQYCQQRTQIATGWCDASGWPRLGDVRVAHLGLPPSYADVYALVSGGGDRKIFETTPLDFTRQNARPVGIDATIPFTPTLSFVTTVGPDFSNVESDQTTIAPQEFALQYNETRPFFAQGAGFLSALPLIGINAPPDRAFYTPSLGIVDDGFKIEGTEGLSSIGALQVKGDGFDDRAFGYRFKRPDGSLSLGLQGVDADHPGVRDRTIGVGGEYDDQRSGLDPSVSYLSETGTRVDRPALAQSLFGGINYLKGPFQGLLFYKDIGPEYAPIDGFTANPDVRGPIAVAQYAGVPKHGVLKADTFGAGLDRFVDRSGAAHQADANFSGSVTTRSLLSASASVSTSELRTYEQAYPVYTGDRTYVFDQVSLTAGYHDGTPSPADASYAFGPFAVFCPGGPQDPLPCRTDAKNGFAQAFVDQLDLSTTRTFHGGLAATFEYGGTVERAYRGASDSQWLRRVALTHPVGGTGQLALVLREISGTGGFALPGETLAVSYQNRFANQDRLFVEFGSPASYRTLNRFIVKYVRHVGKGGAGT